MRHHTFWRAAGVVFGMVALFVAGCGSSSNAGSSSTPPANTVNVTAGSFAPFITVIKAGDTVTWNNKDSAPHHVVTTPKPGAVKGDTSGFTDDTSSFLNLELFSLNIPAGGSAKQSFAKPGLYDYFDDTQATWNADISRVAANKGATGFPMAMEGVIWVQGNISGLPTSAKNGVLSGADDFLFDFVAIQKGGTVSWQNFDTDKHFVGNVTGWSAPINPDKIGTGLNQVNGTDDAPPNGQTVSFTLNTPGLYYYYCATHADIDSATHRVKAHDDASAYPTPMEGFVLVI